MTIVTAVLLGSRIVAAAEEATRDDGMREALIEALAEARFEADRLRARLETLEFGRRDGGWIPGDVPGSIDVAAMETLRVLDVNRQLRMVIISGGYREGLRPGMRFALMRGSESTARVRVIDVRGAISGAVIEQERSRRSAAVADRPVLLREEL